MKIINLKSKMFIILLLLVMVCVAMPQQQASAAVKLNKKNISVIKGENFQLRIKGTKKKAKWSSTSTGVATVDKNGNVTGKNIGTTTIIAKVNKKQYTCIVKVIGIDCRTHISTEDGGDLITSDSSSKSVLDISLSHKVSSLVVTVCDHNGQAVKKFTFGSSKSVKCIWDLTDSANNKVPGDRYHYNIQTLGETFETHDIFVYDMSVFASGNGSKTSPYEVTNLEQLNEIQFYDGMSFIQTADINVNYAKYNPLFTEDDPFMGEYNGNGHTISNVAVDNEEADNIALFSVIGEDGVVKNLNISQCSFSGNSNIGAIAGTNNGEILDCNIKETDIVAKAENAGGVCGINNGKIDGSVTTQGSSVAHKGNVGSVAGYNKPDGVISSHKSSDGNIKSLNCSDGAGGIVGYNEGKIEKCEVVQADISDVFSWGHDVFAGGVTAYNKGIITECTVSNCKIESSNETDWYTGISYVGGISGYNTGTISVCVITSCQIWGNSEGLHACLYNGGVTGGNEAVVARNNVILCDISGEGEGGTYNGGIIGTNSGSNSHNTYDGMLEQIGEKKE